MTPRRDEEYESQQTLRSIGQAFREKLDGNSRVDETREKDKPESPIGEDTGTWLLLLQYFVTKDDSATGKQE